MRTLKKSWPGVSRRRKRTRKSSHRTLSQLVRSLLPKSCSSRDPEASQCHSQGQLLLCQQCLEIGWQWTTWPMGAWWRRGLLQGYLSLLVCTSLQTVVQCTLHSFTRILTANNRHTLTINNSFRVNNFRASNFVTHNPEITQCLMGQCMQGFHRACLRECSLVQELWRKLVDGRVRMITDLCCISIGPYQLQVSWKENSTAVVHYSE